MCWLWVLASVSTVNKVARANSPVLVQLFPIVLQAWCSISRRYGPEFPMMFSGLCLPSTDIRGSHRLGGEAFVYAHPPRPVLAHLAQFEETNEPIMARTNFFYLLVSTPCSGLLVFSARLFQPFTLRDGCFYFGTAPWFHFLCVHGHGPLRMSLLPG